MADTALWFDSALLPDGWARQVRITLRSGHIESVRPNTPSEAGDEIHAIALPGMSNLHSHAFQRVIAGLTERRGPSSDSFWSWREQMYRFQTRIGPDELKIIATLAYMEMLESGFTRVGEFQYLHHNKDGTPFDDPAEMSAALCAAAGDTGLAMTLLPVFYAHSGFGGQEPTQGQARFIHSVDAFARLLEACQPHLNNLPDAVLGIAPHSLRAVTPEELTALLPLCADGPIHIHISEQIREVEQSVAHFGARPVEWLMNNMPVDARWCLVHATHMTEAETLGLAQSGAVAGLCPITEANLGDGVFPAEAFLNSGGRIGIGSDSNVLINAAEELRLLEYSQRFVHKSRNVLAEPLGSTGARLYKSSVAGGAQALKGTAGLAENMVADIVSLDATAASLAARQGDDILDSHIFASTHNFVDCVWRHGHKQVSGGKHVHHDRIVSAYSALMERLTA
ncbi:MAG: formimidoylglutamate deiminase [Asticcacaulis sp.]